MKDARRSKCKFVVLNSGRAGMRTACLKAAYSSLVIALLKVVGAKSTGGSAADGVVGAAVAAAGLKRRRR
eukprot:6803112-Alexandrium_andersonii.AAC.1